MLTSSALLGGVLLPAVAAGILSLAGWRFRRSTDTSDRDAWAPVAGLGAGYLAGHAVVFGWPAIPPVEATQWLFVATIAAVALGIVETPWHPRLRWTARALLAGAALVAMSRPLITYSWGVTQAVAWLLGLWLAALMLWLAMERSLASLPGSSGWFCLCILGAGCSVALASSGSLALGQLGGAAAAATGGVAAVSSLCGGRRFTPAAVPVAGMVLFGLLLAGYFYSELPASSALLLAASPLAARAVHAATRQRSGTLAFLAPVAGMLLPVLAAVVIAALGSPRLDAGY